MRSAPSSPTGERSELQSPNSSPQQPACSWQEAPRRPRTTNPISGTWCVPIRCSDAGFFMVASLTDSIGDIFIDESELNAPAAAISSDTAAPAAASAELPIISSRPSSPPPKPPPFWPITGSGAPHATQPLTAPHDPRSAGVARAGALSPVGFPELTGGPDAARRLSSVLVDQKDARSRSSYGGWPAIPQSPETPI